MDRDPYENTAFPWQEQQQDIYYEQPSISSPRYEWDRQKLRVPTAPRPRERAMGIVGSLKKGIVVAAIVAFGTFGLVTANLVGAHNSWGFPGRDHFPMSQPGHFQDHHGFFHHHHRGEEDDFGS